MISSENLNEEYIQKTYEISNFISSWHNSRNLTSERIFQIF